MKEIASGFTVCCLSAIRLLDRVGLGVQARGQAAEWCCVGAVCSPVLPGTGCLGEEDTVV